MIGYNYIRKPITGDKAKEIAKNHPQTQGKTQTNGIPQKMPDKFSVQWK